MSKRKKYTPKHVNPMAFLIGMRGAMLLGTDDVLSRTAELVASIDSLSRGEVDKAVWTPIMRATSMTEMFVRLKLAQGAEVVDSLQSTILAIMERQLDGKIALRAAELAELRGFAEDYSAILQGVTHQQFFQAEEMMQRRIDAWKRGTKVKGLETVKAGK
jgi:hypothetical protein